MIENPRRHLADIALAIEPLAQKDGWILSSEFDPSRPEDNPCITLTLRKANTGLQVAPRRRRAMLQVSPDMECAPGDVAYFVYESMIRNDMFLFTRGEIIPFVPYAMRTRASQTKTVETPGLSDADYISLRAKSLLNQTGVKVEAWRIDRIGTRLTKPKDCDEEAYDRASFQLEISTPDDRHPDFMHPAFVFCSAKEARTALEFANAVDEERQRMRIEAAQDDDIPAQAVLIEDGDGSPVEKPKSGGPCDDPGCNLKQAFESRRCSHTAKHEGACDEQMVNIELEFKNASVKTIADAVVAKIVDSGKLGDKASVHGAKVDIVLGQTIVNGSLEDIAKAVQSELGKSVRTQAWRNYPYSTGGGY